MPIIDTQDARDLDNYLQRFFDSTPSERPHRLRLLFTEKFDFNAATGKVSLAKAPKNVTLPSDAERIASIEGINVVYVPLEIPGTTRVRKAEAAAAARLIAGQMGDDMLLLISNQQTDGEVSQLHVIIPTFTGATPALRRMVIERDLPRRTTIQQLSNIYHDWKEKGDLRLALEKAFDVEAVTKDFFEDYSKIFKLVQGLVTGFQETDEGREDKKLFVQTLFNRLMFIYFLSRKGWLKFDENPDYLAAVWKDYKDKKEESNFYEGRLKNVFFVALNNPRSADLRKDNPTLYALVGDVPFLNGGLFNREGYDDDSDITIPDEAIQVILKDLFEHYNFTVMESTPLDQEVAVDPEMLGKVFEELVTGRHETGSYYTPRPVVSFMCREALKGYLQGAVTTLPTEAIELFVDHHDVSGLNLTSAEAVRKALTEIKVVDPACGSGAYLLGMMHALVELETALYSEKLLMDTKSLYDLKLRIIEENVYGVDIDQFAVNVAMLRLWLSLTIDYESFPPLPLPNLDFKIVCGDSLLGPDPNPDNYGTLFRHRVHEIASQLADLKGRHLKATGQEKDSLFSEIEGLQGELREVLSDEAVPEEAADWRVEFAEVFDQNGGFDVVIANPPYVRQENIGPNKPKLRRLFAEAVTGMSDFYCYFYARGVQLLRVGGMHVFVCSNSWLDVGYGAKLQEFLLKTTWIRAVYDSAVERQFSTAAINTIISIIQKTQTRRDEATHFISLKGPFDAALADQSLRREIVVNKKELYEGGIGQEPESKSGANYIGDKWGGKYLRAPDIYYTILEKSKGKLVPFGHIADIRRGFTTGANEFFYFDELKMREWGIEERFLKPVLKSPREVRSIKLDPATLAHKLFVCTDPKSRLKGTKALAYIQWGETQVTKGRQKQAAGIPWPELPSFAGKDLWYSIGLKPAAHVFCNRFFSNRYFFCYCPGVVEDQTFYGAILRNQLRSDSQIALLNSTFQHLLIALLGRVALGGGVLQYAVFEMKRLPVLNADGFDETFAVRLTKKFEVLREREVLPEEAEVLQRDRRDMDSLIAQALGMPDSALDDLYDAVVRLTHDREEKAGSVKR